jgi:TRAP-type transport system small permease protein
MGILRRVNAGVTGVFRYGAVLFLAAMTFVILLQVLFRYVFNAPLSWPEEAARYMMVWMTFLILPYAYRAGLMVRLETLAGRLPMQYRRWLEIALHGWIVILAVLMLRESVWLTREGGAMTSSALGLNMRYVFVILPVSMALVIAVGVERIAELGTKSSAPEAAAS